jgi:hypothetical protein
VFYTRISTNFEYSRLLFVFQHSSSRWYFWCLIPKYQRILNTRASSSSQHQSLWNSSLAPTLISVDFLVFHTQISTTLNNLSHLFFVFNINIVGISWCLRPKSQRLLNFSGHSEDLFCGLAFLLFQSELLYLYLDNLPTMLTIYSKLLLLPESLFRTRRTLSSNCLVALYVT